MGKKKNILIIPSILLLLVISGLWAKEKTAVNHLFRIRRIGNYNYISLYDLIKKLGIENTFDIISRRGKLYYKSHQVVYRPGYSYILADQTLIKSEYPVMQVKGEIFVPLLQAEKILTILFPALKAERSKGYLIVPRDFNRNKISNVKIIKNRQIKDKIDFIIVDPGHGGRDPGAIGRGRIKEKIITLKIARRVAKHLRRKVKGVKIRLTRRNDRFLELSARTDISNKYLKKNNNGIFISIHVNASLSGRISGFETYFLSQNPTNEDARNTAALENNVIVLEDHKGKKYGDIDYIEAMMMTTQIQKESSMLAYEIQRGMKRKIRKFKSRGVRKADFYVLRGSLMPAVLIEVGFITNRREARYLTKSSYQEKIAAGIADGVVRFIKKYYKSIKK